MNIFKIIINFLLPKEKSLIFTTFATEDYFRAKSKLQGAGIVHRSKITNQVQQNDMRSFSSRGLTQYDLYVSKEDVYRAQEAMRK
ncbi:hypothetical protein A8990_101442 [Paenibacillus taihuensis]|uniref:Signal transducing protein n=1 Tax=Paenibacillus taihuensis TaxID=1156355 RepID=A0A3D9SFG1_9BACL|nr:hypothetical protein [Paenibacillus taihuensis]REE94646.1 hypothetical protein A8990_101442 [Paenibacillus taihuensis]